MRTFKIHIQWYIDHHLLWLTGIVLLCPTAIILMNFYLNIHWGVWEVAFIVFAAILIAGIASQIMERKEDHALEFPDSVWLVMGAAVLGAMWGCVATLVAWGFDHLANLMRSCVNWIVTGNFSFVPILELSVAMHLFIILTMLVLGSIMNENFGADGDDAPEHYI